MFFGRRSKINWFSHICKIRNNKPPWYNTLDATGYSAYLLFYIVQVLSVPVKIKSKRDLLKKCVDCRFTYTTLSSCQVLALKMLGLYFPVLEGTLRRDTTKFTAILRCHYFNLPSQRVNSWAGCSVLWERRREGFWRWLHCWGVALWMG